MRSLGLALQVTGLTLIVATGCANSATVGHQSTTIVISSTLIPSTTSTIASPSTSTSTSTTSTTLPVQISGLLADVVSAAALGPISADVPLENRAATKSPLYKLGCQQSSKATEPKFCEFGDLASKIVIVLTGDSHAAQWFGGFEIAARNHHWKLLTLTKSSCPNADVSVLRRKDDLINGEEILNLECDIWREKAHIALRALHPNLVVFPLMARYRLVTGPDTGPGTGPGVWGEGLGRSITAVSGEGTKVLVLGESAKTNGVDIPSCLRDHQDDISQCGNSRSNAFNLPKQEASTTAALQHGALFISPGDWFCTVDFCPAVIARTIVYRDYNHISDQFARYRAPQITAAVLLALAGPDAF